MFNKQMFCRGAVAAIVLGSVFSAVAFGDKPAQYYLGWKIAPLAAAPFVSGSIQLSAAPVVVVGEWNEVNRTLKGNQLKPVTPNTTPREVRLAASPVQPVESDDEHLECGCGDTGTTVIAKN